MNLLKMVCLLKLLYFFRNTPIPTPKSFICRLDSLITSFVWAGKTPRLAKRTLQLPLSHGGLAMPHFQLYYWAAVLVMVRWWFSQPKQNPAVQLEAAILGSYVAVSNLVYRGPRAHLEMTTPMRTTIRVWLQAGAVYKVDSKISPHTPLWNNPRLPHLYTLPFSQLWASRELWPSNIFSQTTLFHPFRY